MKFNFDETVGLIANPDVKFVIGIIRRTAEGYIYGENANAAQFHEDSLQKVVPKKMFYLWVNPDGSLYGRLLDSTGTTVDGYKRDILYMVNTNTGVELELIETPLRKKKIVKKREDDDEDDFDDAARWD